MNSKRNQQGIVLLTCLVFLMVLLAMLRFALMSARSEEEKAGADLDIMTAREAAQMGLDEAEAELYRWAGKNCGSQERCKGIGIEDKDYEELLTENLSSLFQDESYQTKAFMDKAWDGKSQLAYGHGLYDAKSFANFKNCRPTWICMKWRNDATAVIDAAAAQRKVVGAPTPSFEVLPQDNRTSPWKKPYQYVFERFTPGELTDGASTDSDSAVMRITAVGVGRGDGGNKTSVMLQSTYILP